MQLGLVLHTQPENLVGLNHLPQWAEERVLGPDLLQNGVAGEQVHGLLLDKEELPNAEGDKYLSRGGLGGKG